METDAVTILYGKDGTGGVAGHIREETTKIIHNYLDDLRSEEHTSELQSRTNLVCRLLLEKKKHKKKQTTKQTKKTKQTTP